MQPLNQHAASLVIFNLMPNVATLPLPAEVAVDGGRGEVGEVSDNSCSTAVTAHCELADNSYNHF